MQHNAFVADYVESGGSLNVNHDSAAELQIQQTLLQYVIAHHDLGDVPSRSAVCEQPIHIADNGCSGGVSRDWIAVATRPPRDCDKNTGRRHEPGYRQHQHLLRGRSWASDGARCTNLHCIFLNLSAPQRTPQVR
ncbi:MAG: hypothetical protein AAFN70_14555, partial [Planctomycetota bacterium]